jgi:glycosyltransferase involved in cell wall biosynthesis
MLKRMSDAPAEVTGRILIVAYYFPPIGGIGSIRLARFASLLPEHGWEVTVLAPRDTPHEQDPRLTFPEAKVIRARSIEFSRVGRTVTRTGPSFDPSRSSARSLMRAIAHRYLFFPDPQIGWYPSAVRAGLQALRKQRFDAIYSSADPVTAHLIARTLSRRSGLPWVAESRDPIAARLTPDDPHFRRAERLEAAIAREATVMVVPTPTWATHYGSMWGRDVAVLPNAHDGRLPERRRPAQPTVAHVGTYHAGRDDLTALWEALALMRKRQSALLPRVRFIGHPSPELDQEVGRYGLNDLVDNVGFVSHDEAMLELMSASMLLASGIRGDDPVARGWVPAKVFTYIASGLPVLYLSAPDADAAALMRDQPGCYVVDHRDVEGALRALEEGLAGPSFARDAEHLGRAARTRLLAEILERAVAGEPPEPGSAGTPAG